MTKTVIRQNDIVMQLLSLQPRQIGVIHGVAVQCLEDELFRSETGQDSWRGRFKVGNEGPFLMLETVDRVMRLAHMKPEIEAA